MGNSGSKPYVPPPPEEMPIEDSVASRKEVATLMAEKSSGASRSANNLEQETADNAKAVTREQIAKTEAFAPQSQPRGPVGNRPRGPRMAPGSMVPVSGSAVLTG